MYERFTDRARKVMRLASQEAMRFNHQYIGTEHILLGLVREGTGVGANVFKNLDVDLLKVRLEVDKVAPSGPDLVTMGKLPQTPRAKKVIEYSFDEARDFHHDYVGTEHLLLGLLREQEGVAAQVLSNLGLKLDSVRKEVLYVLGDPGLTRRAYKVMQFANQEALRFNYEHVGTEHIFLGLVKEAKGVTANVFKNLGIDLCKIRLEVENIVQARQDMVTIGKLFQTPNAKRIIKYSIEEARHLHHNYVGMEHLLLGLLRDLDDVAARALKDHGIELEDVREEVLNVVARSTAFRVRKALALIITVMLYLGWLAATRFWPF